MRDADRDTLKAGTNGGQIDGFIPSVNGALVPETGSMTTLIVHDQPLVGEGIKSLLGEMDIFCDFEYASNAAEALRKLEGGSVDLVFLGLFLCDEGSLDILAKIRNFDAAVPVIVLSDTESASVIRKAVQNGASGFIVETAPREVMIHAINMAITGQRLALLPLSAISQPDNGSDNARVPFNDIADLRDRYARLTEQEARVLGYIREGMSNKEIARELGIFEGTVKVHVKSVFRKLHAKNRTMAALMAAGVMMHAGSGDTAGH